MQVLQAISWHGRVQFVSWSEKVQQLRGGMHESKACAQGNEITLAAASVTVLPGPVEPTATIVQLLPNSNFAMTSSTTVQVSVTILQLV